MPWAFMKNMKKRKFKDINEKMADSTSPQKTKMIIDFNGCESASIKSFAVKKKTKSKSLLDLFQANC